MCIRDRNTFYVLGLWHIFAPEKYQWLEGWQLSVVVIVCLVLLLGTLIVYVEEYRQKQDKGEA